MQDITKGSVNIIDKEELRGTLENEEDKRSCIYYGARNYFKPR